MFQIKIKDCVDLVNNSRILVTKSYPAKLSYDINKIFKLVGEEVKLYDEERLKLCEKYGQLNEEKTNYIIESQEEFRKELEELLNKEVEIQTNKIKIDLLEKYDFTLDEIDVISSILEV